MWSRIWFGIFGMVWWLSGNLIYGEEAGVKTECSFKQQRAIAKTIHSSQSEERLMGARQIDFDRRREMPTSVASDIVAPPSLAPAFCNLK